MNAFQVRVGFDPGTVMLWKQAGQEYNQDYPQQKRKNILGGVPRCNQHVFASLRPGKKEY